MAHADPAAGLPAVPPADRVALVIVTYNRSDMLGRLLDSIDAMDPAPWAIILIDNASTDDTGEVVAAWRARTPHQRVEHRRMAENIGGSGGFNAGVEVAVGLGASWSWLMDDDVLVIGDALALLRPWMERFSVLHGRRYDASGEPFYWQARFNRFLGVPLPYSGKHLREHGYAVTNSGTFEGMVVHSDIVRLIGLPDPRFFITWDDAVYAWLASRHTEVAYVDAFVLHRQREQRQVNLGVRHLNDGSPLFRFHMMRNRAYVAKYFAAHGQLNRFGFGIGTALTFAKEVFRLVVVQRTLTGFGDLVRGFRENRRLRKDDSWHPMDPADVPPPPH
ncbi:MAG: glycosyltransferase [Aeromicrobium sp.]|uniref:glycosyltransferase n=1 Tax=Aeromicrobium sp. TaxID=1871063 RepID=UPI0039E46B6A